MKISLANRVALVSGAAQGIGRGIALILARAGADVVVCDIQADKGLATVDAIENLGCCGLCTHAAGSAHPKTSATSSRLCAPTWEVLSTASM